MFLATSKARAMLKGSVELSDFVWQTANLAGFISGCYTDDLDMWPCSCHCGSNIGDLLGMRTYSMSRSVIESSQVVSIELRRRFKSMAGST